MGAEADSICGITSVTGGRPENRGLSPFVPFVQREEMDGLVLVCTAICNMQVIQAESAVSVLAVRNLDRFRLSYVS